LRDPDLWEDTIRILSASEHDQTLALALDLPAAHECLSTDSVGDQWKQPNGGSSSGFEAQVAKVNRLGRLI
jgi:hypothetical protein